jgi:O-antigen chain-terminating methyltransferase
MTGFDVHAVMSRVREHVTRRTALADRQPRTGLPAILDGAAMPDLERKPAYRLADFMPYSDEAFIRNVYVAVLGRLPDAEGAAFHLDNLRAGRADKVEVIAAVRWSREGVGRGVHIDGLLVPTILRRWQRKPFIGPVLAWLYGLARIARVPAQLASIESGLARQTTSLGHRFTAISSAIVERDDALYELIGAAEARITRVEAEGEARREVLHARLDAASARTMNLEAAAHTQQATLEARIEEALDALDDLSGAMGDLASAHADLASLQANDPRFDTLRSSLAALEGRFSVLSDASDAAERADERRRAFDRSLDSFYVAFEKHFRGSPELIRERMLPYVGILEDARVGDAAHPVLDLGCGNGDWLDLLRQLGYVARGVDSNRTFVELCRGRGLDVVEGDVLDYLRASADASLGCVTGIHIAEHLPFDVLIKLLDECRRVLCVGGVLALETPNPENLLVGSHFFYMDPTHRNPLPPEALRWIVEARGFAMTRIERWTQARPMNVPQDVGTETPGAQAVNTMLSHLRVAPDYAVVARRL